MRILLAALLLSACATAIPSQRVNGCWVSQEEGAAPATLRFTPDRNRPGILHGALIRNGVRENYDLRQYVTGWSFCQMEAGGDHCWQVAEAESGSLEGGRAFIDSEANHLRISIIGQEGERVIFQGERGDCQ
jgi:hypothetical protein